MAEMAADARQFGGIIQDSGAWPGILGCGRVVILCSWLFRRVLRISAIGERASAGDVARRRDYRGFFGQSQVCAPNYACRPAGGRRIAAWHCLCMKRVEG